MKRRSVIFIHGIGPIARDYSQALWDDILWQGHDPGDIHRYEVYYYDIFKMIEDRLEIEKFVEKYGVLDLLDNYIKSEDTLKKVGQALTTVLKDTISHIFYYLLHEDTRIAVTNRFRKILAQAIKDGVEKDIFPRKHEITIISHSLGTVVAYVGLHTVIGESELGITDGVKIKNLFTLATPLAAIKEISSRIPHISLAILSNDLKKPVLWNENKQIDETNIDKWFSYRHKLDPVASLIPTTGNLLSSDDASPFVFDVVHQKNIHAFENYLTQARQLIVEQTKEAL